MRSEKLGGDGTTRTPGITRIQTATVLTSEARKAKVLEGESEEKGARKIEELTAKRMSTSPPQYFESDLFSIDTERNATEAELL